MLKSTIQRIHGNELKLAELTANDITKINEIHNGETLLNNALKSNSEPALKVILQVKELNVNVKSENTDLKSNKVAELPVVVAMKNLPKDSSITSAIIEHPSFDVTQTFDNQYGSGYTAFHTAAGRNLDEAFIALCKVPNAPIAIQKGDNNSYMPIHDIAKNGNNKQLALAIQFYQDLNPAAKGFVNGKPNANKTPLFYALEKYFILFEQQKDVKEQLKTIEILLENGADLEFKIFADLTVQQWATENIEMFKQENEKTDFSALEALFKASFEKEISLTFSKSSSVAAPSTPISSINTTEKPAASVNTAPNSAFLSDPSKQLHSSQPESVTQAKDSHTITKAQNEHIEIDQNMFTL